MTPDYERPAASISKENRLVLGSCCVALGTLVPVALYQSGILPRLPDPPLCIFDSQRITISDAAHPFGIPDGWLGLGSFGTTFVLAMLGRRNRTAKKLLGAKLTLDAAAAVFNATRQVVCFGKLCSWCTGTALAAGVMAYGGRAAIQEAWKEPLAESSPLKLRQRNSERLNPVTSTRVEPVSQGKRAVCAH